jgi:putative membrane protein
MNIMANLIVAFIALLHLYFMALEMFLWQTPYGLKTFAMTPDMASATATLAANQGLYNGFLAAGLFWGVIAEREGFAIKVFFLTCVILAGIFGGMTAKTTILFIQALPAAVALMLVLAAHRARA